MARRTLTDAGVKRLTADKHNHPDPELSGHYVRITPAGVRSFACVARDPAGKQVWFTLGRCDSLSITDARELAKAARARIKAGLPPREPEPEPEAAPVTFASEAADWFKREMEGRRHSAAEVQRILDRQILPAWGTRPFTSIRRGDVSALLDHIEDAHGKRSADYALAIVRRLMNWHATRTEGYVNPIVKGMGRGGTVKRERILTDAELRAVWAATAGPGAFNGIVRMLLLSGQRREQVAAMRWSDLDAEGVWCVPQEARGKGTGGALRLPAAALAIVEGQPRVEGSAYVFGGGAAPFSGWSKAKAALDGRSGTSAWTLHDLRRTARSLMSRAGVRPDVAERVLGHVIPGVEGIYDRHTYAAEKGHALAALARLVAEVIDGAPAGNVVSLRA